MSRPDVAAALRELADHFEELAEEEGNSTYHTGSHDGVLHHSSMMDAYNKAADIARQRAEDLVERCGCGSDDPVCRVCRCCQTCCDGYQSIAHKTFPRPERHDYQPRSS